MNDKKISSTEAEKLTVAQENLLRYLEYWLESNPQIPTRQEICRAVKISTTTHFHAMKLFLDSGYIAYKINPNGTSSKDGKPRQLTPGQMKMLTYLKDWFKTNTSFPDNEEIAAALNLSVATVPRLLRPLRNNGYIYLSVEKSIIADKPKEPKRRKAPQELTGKQEKLLWYLIRWFNNNQHQMPTHKDLAREVGISTSGVHHMLKMLEEKGYIYHVEGKDGVKRTKVRQRLKSQKMLDVPITGIISKGIPILLGVELGFAQINPNIANGHELFAVKVIGDGNHDNTHNAILVFGRRQIPADGNVILAEYNRLLVFTKVKFNRTEIMLSMPQTPVLLSARDAPQNYYKISPCDTLTTIAVLITGFRNGEYEYL